MNERGPISEAWHRPALGGRAAAHHLRWITIASLILAFMAGDHIPSAQAQTPAPRADLFDHVPDLPERICPGDEFVIYMFVNISYPATLIPSPRGGFYGQYHVAGVPIEVRGAAHGRVDPSTSITRWLPSMGSDPMFATMAPFVYQARDPGKETLSFWTDYAGGRKTTYEFTVEDCDPLVAMLYRGNVDAGAGHGMFFGTMGPVRLLSEGESEEQLSATASFHLSESWVLPVCVFGGSGGSTQADISAERGEDVLSLTITLQPSTSDRVATGGCEGFFFTAATGWGTPPAPIEVTIPSSGGAALHVEAAPGYRGEYIVILQRENDSAVSARVPAWAGSGQPSTATLLTYLP